MQPSPLLTRLWDMLVHTKDVFLSPATPLPVKIVGRIFRGGWAARAGR